MGLQGIRKPFVNADGTKALAVANQATIYTNSVKIEYGEFFGLELTGASTPDQKIELEQSNEAPTTERSSDAGYVVPEGVSDIATNFTSTTKKIYSLSPTPASYLRLKITGNAGNGANATLTATLFLQAHA